MDKRLNNLIELIKEYNPFVDPFFGIIVWADGIYGKIIDIKEKGREIIIRYILMNQKYVFCKYDLRDSQQEIKIKRRDMIIYNIKIEPMINAYFSIYIKKPFLKKVNRKEFIENLIGI